MKEKILISGYTKRDSKGVYSVTLDTEAKQLSDLELVCEVSGPTYMAMDQEDHLYTVAANDRGYGGLAAFSYEEPIASLINTVLANGASNCHVSIDENRNLVYGANYHLGEVRVYRRASSDGSLMLTDTVKHEDHHGPKPEQNAPHVHFAVLTPDGRLAVCDLGNDQLYSYEIQDDDTLKEIAVYHSEEGAGPRHLVFHPDGRTAYLACELDSTIEVLDYDSETGIFSQIQKIRTIPGDYTDFNGVAAIRISSDGKFVYVSNRGHDSISIFKIVSKGKGRFLMIVDIIKTEGHIPRDFNFADNEKFIIVAHQESDNLSLFARDAETGELELLQKDFYCPEGTCVLPIK